MTYAEFIKSALPPAPEDPGLRRLRVTTAVLCLTSAVSLALVRGVASAVPWLAVFIVLLSIFSFGLLIYLFVRRVRRDLAYWTPERVEQFRPSAQHTTGIDASTAEILVERR